MENFFPEFYIAGKDSIDKPWMHCSEGKGAEWSKFNAAGRFFRANCIVHSCTVDIISKAVRVMHTKITDFFKIDKIEMGNIIFRINFRINWGGSVQQ